MKSVQPLILAIALASAVSTAALAQSAEVRSPPPAPLLTAAPRSAPTAQVEAVAPAAEVAPDQLVKAGDDKLSCEALRGEIRGLAELVRQKEKAAEAVQVASLDKATAERLAAANRARAATQAQTDKARLEAKTQIEAPNIKFDPANPVKPAEPNLDGIETLKAEFKGGASTLSPAQMRQYGLSYIAYGKGC